MVVVGTLLSGAVVTETVFAWPGVGRLMVESVLRRDYPVIQAGVLLTACIFVFVNRCCTGSRRIVSMASDLRCPRGGCAPC
jgi:ABC-type dipeptide/oligopeptide/nickel transport system permease component